MSIISDDNEYDKNYTLKDKLRRQILAKKKRYRSDKDKNYCNINANN